jgi:subtilisin family serine protease
MHRTTRRVVAGAVAVALALSLLPVTQSITAQDGDKRFKGYQATRTGSIQVGAATGLDRTLASTKLSVGKGGDPDMPGYVAPILGEKGVPKADYTTPEGLVQIAITLTEAPTAQAYLSAGGDTATSAAVAGASAQRARIETQQDAVISALDGAGVKLDIKARTYAAVNTIIALTEATNLSLIATTPGVKSIWLNRNFTTDHTTSVPFVGAPGGSWANGITGTGVRVAILDSGVDYNHATFGPTAFPFTGTGRVVAGFDFTGNAWTGGPCPASDADPNDQWGHGTHVAGTAVGNGVLTSGAAYLGPYNATTFTSNTFNVGPGVAPQASIYAYKLQGTTNSLCGTAILQALDRIIDLDNDGVYEGPTDRVDVINMSYGYNFGVGGDATIDTDQEALTNAALVGVKMAASAGNAGDTFYISGNPGGNDWVIATAASLDALNGATATFNGDTQVAVPTNSSPAFTTVTGNIFTPADASGCTAYTATGLVAVVNWALGVCGSVTRHARAATAGAIALIIVSDEGGPTINFTGGPTIPNVQVATFFGLDMIASQGSSVTITSVSASDTMAGFSSRGPRSANNDNGITLKPDISAPGVNITSARSATNAICPASAIGACTIGGTSMASPHVAGMLALLVQSHPTWSVQQIKALAMNTAVHDITQTPGGQPPVYGSSRMGTGRMDVAVAVPGQVIAYDQARPELVSVSFGLQENTPETSNVVTRTIEVQNNNTFPVSYNIALDPNLEVPGVSFSLSASSITVPGNGTATVNLTINASPSAASFPHTVDATTFIEYFSTFSAFFGLNFFIEEWISEASGNVIFSPTTNAPSANPMRVAYHTVARPASDMTSPSEYQLIEPGPDYEIGGNGKGNFTGIGFTPFDTVPLLTAYQLLISSPNEPDFFGPFENMGDIQYLGASTDFEIVEDLGGDPYLDGSLFVGLSTYGEWSHNRLSAVAVQVDINEDDTPDAEFFVFNIAQAIGDPANDVQLVLAERSAPVFTGGNAEFLVSFPNYFGAHSVDMHTYNTNAVGFSIPLFYLSDLSFGNPTVISAADPIIRLRATAYTWYYGQVDLTPWSAPYDLSRPVMNFSGGLPGQTAWFDNPDNPFVMRFNGQYTDNTQEYDILAIHHHNGGSNHAQVIRLVPPAGGFTTVGGGTGTGTGTGTGVGSGPVTLPATGYPPADTTSGSLALLAALAGMLLLMGAAYVAKRKQ